MPGAHQVGEILIPDALAVERLDAGVLAGWEDPESGAARNFGDAWLLERRSLVLLVPSVPGRPLQQNVLINPTHSSFGRVALVRTLEVPWDARLWATEGH